MMRNACTLKLLAGALLWISGCAEREAEQAEPAALPIWKPTSVANTPYSQYDIIARQRELFADGGDPDDPSQVFAILGDGCSWYCGGEVQQILASSVLEEQSGFTYDAAHAHDLRWDTAWVEGAPGPGIGESLKYTFSNDCPRITRIYICNGYIKHDQAWLANNRVRTLTLHINGQPIAQLELTDSRAEQRFDLVELGIGPVGRRADGKDLELTFTIDAVYPGSRFDDTAITEIYFAGIDVH